MNLHNCFIEVIIRCVIFTIVILYIIVLKPYLTHHFLRKVQRFRTHHFKQTLSTCIISPPHTTKGCYHELTGLFYLSDHQVCYLSYRYVVYYCTKTCVVQIYRIRES